MPTFVATAKQVVHRESKALSYGGRLNTEVSYGLLTGCLRPLTKGLSYSGRGSCGIIWPKQGSLQEVSFAVLSGRGPGRRNPWEWAKKV